MKLKYYHHFLWLILASFTTISYSQDVVIGDTLGVGTIKQSTSRIYAHADKTEFFLTSLPLQYQPSYGTSLTAYSKNDTINRIVAVSFTDKGVLSTEFFYEDEALIFVYETFEFFKEFKEAAIWQNFKGIDAWESRYYFILDHLICHMHIGRRDAVQWNTVKLEQQYLVKSELILNYVLNQIASEH